MLEKPEQCQSLMVIPVHPSDMQLDDFVLNRLDLKTSGWIEEHVLCCERCLDALTSLDELVFALRASTNVETDTLHCTRFDVRAALAVAAFVAICVGVSFVYSQPRAFSVPRKTQTTLASVQVYAPGQVTSIKAQQRPIHRPSVIHRPFVNAPRQIRRGSNHARLFIPPSPAVSPGVVELGILGTAPDVPAALPDTSWFIQPETTLPQYRRPAPRRFRKFVAVLSAPFRKVIN
jgi:hypothetical protein